MRAVNHKGRGQGRDQGRDVGSMGPHLCPKDRQRWAIRPAVRNRGDRVGIDDAKPQKGGSKTLSGFELPHSSQNRLEWGTRPFCWADCIPIDTVKRSGNDSDENR